MKRCAALSHLFENQSHALRVTSHLCLKSPCPWHEPQDLCPAHSWTTQGEKNSTSAGELKRTGQGCALEREAAMVTASLCGRSRQFYCLQVWVTGLKMHICTSQRCDCALSQFHFFLVRHLKGMTPKLIHLWTTGHYAVVGEISQCQWAVHKMDVETAGRAFPEFYQWLQGQEDTRKMPVDMWGGAAWALPGEGDEQSPQILQPEFEERSTRVK